MAAVLGLKSAKAYRYYENMTEWVSMKKAKEFGEKLGIDLINGESKSEVDSKTLQIILNLSESNKVLSDANKLLAGNLIQISDVLKEWKQK